MKIVQRLDEMEERILVMNRELNRLDRRFAQHEQAVIELATALKEREDAKARKGTVSSAK